MSARSPPRCTSPASTPGGASRCRCEHGSARRRPTHSTAPTRKRRPTRAFSSIPRVTTFRRASSHAISTPVGRERVERLRLDQRQLVAAAAAGERAGCRPRSGRPEAASRRRPRPRRPARAAPRPPGRAAVPRRHRPRRPARRTAATASSPSWNGATSDGLDDRAAARRAARPDRAPARTERRT